MSSHRRMRGIWPLTKSLTASWLVLTLSVVLLYAVVGSLGYGRSGEVGLMATGVAAAVCWAGSSLALLLTGWLRGSAAAVHGVLLGSICRMGLPLAVGVVLQAGGGQLAQAGVFGYIVVFYLATLVVETVLSVSLIDQSRQDLERIS